MPVPSWSIAARAHTLPWPINAVRALSAADQRQCPAHSIAYQFHNPLSAGLPDESTYSLEQNTRMVASEKLVSVGQAHGVLFIPCLLALFQTK